MTNHSRLLLDEPPLVVQRTLARLIGLNEALVLQQIHYWCQVEGQEKEDGQVYVNKSVDDINACFDFWSESTVKRSVTGLVARLWLIKIKSKSWNRTNYYRVDYSQLNAIGEPMHQVKLTQLDQVKMTQCH